MIRISHFYWQEWRFIENSLHTKLKIPAWPKRELLKSMIFRSKEILVHDKNKAVWQVGFLLLWAVVSFSLPKSYGPYTIFKGQLRIPKYFRLTNNYDVITFCAFFIRSFNNTILLAENISYENSHISLLRYPSKNKSNFSGKFSAVLPLQKRQI